MFTLSGFTDEMLVGFPHQLRVLRTLGISHCELRRIGTQSILDADEPTLRRVEKALADAEVDVSCIASSIAKVPLGRPLAEEVEQVRHAAELAHRFGTPHVRVFSYRTRHRDADRAEIIDRLGTLTEAAEATDVTLLMENDKRLYGNEPDRCADVLRSIASPHLRMIFDAANFVQEGVDTLNAYELLREWVTLLHVKDAKLRTGRVVPAGRGDARWPELLEALRRDDFDGFLSLEPHLGLGGRGGPIGPKGWARAVYALRRLLNDLNAG